MFKTKVEESTQKDKNFVLVVKYECGEAGFLTDQPDLPTALKEYTEMRNKMMNDQSKCCPMPLIKEAHLYRIFKEVR